MRSKLLLGGHNLLRIRFGFVAMALSLKNASPSQTMTVTRFKQIADRKAALRKVTRIAEKNLVNTLRILRHAYASGVHVYRFSSKLIPLYGHELTREWDFFRYLRRDFAAIGAFVREKKMRVSFHPEHFTILNSPKNEIVQKAVADLERYVQLAMAMGLDEQMKFVLHVGGGYGDKEQSLARFQDHWRLLPSAVRARLTLENDDKTFTARETLVLSEKLQVPMVLDIHHHQCNRETDSDLRDFVRPIFQTWEGSGLVPKVHISSPQSVKSAAGQRRHADWINPDDLLPFLAIVRELATNEGVYDFDVMIEAKKKDEAVFHLARELASRPGFRQLDGGTVLYE